MPTLDYTPSSLALAKRVKMAKLQPEAARQITRQELMKRGDMAVTGVSRAWLYVWVGLSLALAGAAGSASAASLVYKYDAFGRLIEVDGSTSAGAYITAYTYDAAGNRTAVTTSVAPVPAVGTVSASVYENSSANAISPNVLSSGGTAASVNVVGSGATAHGTAWASGTTLYYTPTTGFYGADSFQYTASNGSGVSPTPATVNVTVIQIPFWGAFYWGGSGLVWQ